MTNCLVLSSTSEAVFAKSLSASSSIWHTTIADNNTTGIYLDTGTLTVTNCIFANNVSAGLKLGSGTLSHTYNLLYGNTPNYDNTSASTGEISVDPQFVGVGNYHLKAGSLAKNAGADGSSQTTVDLENNPRPYDGGWDMGCYEMGPKPKIIKWVEVDPFRP